MKAISVLLFVTVGVALAQPQPPTKPRGQCPPSQGGVGICLFNPDINCTGDEECKDGKLCCPDRCNKSCMKPVFPSHNSNEDVCPPTGIPPIGPCVFDPKVNCVDNSECTNGKVCCSQGCNKICKTPMPRPPCMPPPPTPPKLPLPEYSGNSSDECPPASPVYGACVFNPSTNCVDDGACSNGQVCCSDGCNKVCMEPKRVSTCPKVSGGGGNVGICLFNPEVNCSDDSACKNGKICCSDGGCNKVCVNPEPVRVHDATKP